MIANTSKDTKPELRVRQRLRKAGYPGYRLHWRIDDADGKYVCRPDITYPGRKLAIFVHGCFWHRCPKCNLGLPKTNVVYWSEKFGRNVERDRRKECELIEMGWDVQTIWECEVNDGLVDVSRIIR
tara:strand:+ start:97 stop:474 length:378 start_codon:yes stop_codon:yes gene_type:complete